LSRVISVLIRCCRTIDQSSQTRLVKNLYPSEPVSREVVLRVACSLGACKTKPPAATQHLLAQWLVSVYEVLQDQAHVARLYSLLFNCLDLLSIRRPICHLLCYLTRRKHVTPARVRALLELIRSAGDDGKELVELLRVFKSFYPDIIIGNASLPRGRSIFKPLDPDWHAHLRGLRAAQQSSQVPPSIGTTTSIKVDRGLAKRSKIEVVIPVLKTARDQTAAALSLPAAASSASAPLSLGFEDLRTISDFVTGFDKISLPCQIISLLRSPTAMRYLQLVQNVDLTRRMEAWLAAAFAEEVELLFESTSRRFPDTTIGLINALVEYARFNKQLPATAHSFVRRLLTLTRDIDDYERLLPLTTWLTAPDGEIVELIFSRLDDLSRDPSTAVRARVLAIDSLAAVVRRRATMLRAIPPTVASSSPPLQQLVTLCQDHVFAITQSCSSLPASDQSHLGFAAIRFFSTLADVFSNAPIAIRVVAPPAAAVYQLAFSPTLGHLTSLCGILSRYKAALNRSAAVAAAPAQSPTVEPPTADVVAQVDGHVIDICNLLWRNRALNTGDSHATGCLLPSATIDRFRAYFEEISSATPEGTKYQLSTAFSLSFGISTVMITAACMRDILRDAGLAMPYSEGQVLDHEGAPVRQALAQPVTQRTLSMLEAEHGLSIDWQEFRKRVLDWAERRACHGIGSLMRSTLASSRNAI
ncbi:hypothetical protein KEM52_004924, partial [Ascosphaera acerosa]